MAQNEVQWFTKDNGKKLPVSDDFLLPFLTPTSPGTNYWDSPPPNNEAAMERNKGRVLLQLHQIIDVLSRVGTDLKGKSLLDVGTGNGMIPRLVLHYSDLESAVGIDPYLDGEHKTSWQSHDHGTFFKDTTQFIDSYCKDEMDFAKYAHLTGYQDFTIRPARVALKPQGKKQFRFEKIGAHDLGNLNEKFDLFYAKAIDHIPDWPGIFKACAAAAKNDALIVIKHFSFFALVGPHRYSTTNIPWGHLLMTDAEYRRFAEEFHDHRSKEMTDFYFNGLAFPRSTIHQMIMMAAAHGFAFHALINEPSRNCEKLLPLTEHVPDFWSNVRENHPTVSVDEMLSGRFHIVFRKIEQAGKS